ncbi:MAG: hypothetical protein K2J71_00490, partial [Oscillospiraceae bacterium]|nr:hypothetical protein [Oscillospiraceae bacterium]
HMTVHQKLVAMTESYEIRSGNQIAYTAKKKIISAGADFKIMQGKDVIAEIDEKILPAVRTFRLLIRGQRVAVVKQQIHAISKDMFVEPFGWKLDGDLTGTDFKFTDRGHVYAKVHKKMIALSDTYEVDFDDPENALLIAMLVIVLDETFHSKRSEK